MDHDRELAKAIARGDCAEASVCLDMMVRDRVRPSAHRVALGRAEVRHPIKSAA